MILAGVSLLCLGVAAQFKGVREPTITFSEEKGTYFDTREADAEARTIAGMVIGFTCTGLFFIYVAVRIIMDESARTAFYKKKVMACE